MQDVSFSVLGGIGENGKNLYLLKIKSSYFVLDSGSKHPNITSVHGIDSVIPEYTVLEDVHSQIQGIFITSALETHSGALSYLIKYLKVPIYASDFVIDVVEANLEQYNESLNIEEFDFKTINENIVIDLEDTKVSFFGISHFLPETLGLAFETEHGSIVYVSEMYFLQFQNKNFKTNFSALSKLGSQKVLSLMTASQGIYNVASANKDELLEYNLSSYFSSIENNIIISFLIPDLLKIQLVIDLAIESNLKVVLLGRKNEPIIDIALKKKYLKIPNNFLINLKNMQDYLKYKNLVVIIVGKRFEPLYRLQRMCKQTDRLMKLHPKDKILLLSIVTSGIDKIQNKTIDSLSRNGFIVDVVVKDLLTSYYNYEENFKLMLDLLKPKYLLPIGGEFRHQYQMKKIAIKNNFLENDIFMMENGDSWIVDNQNRPHIRKNFFKKIGEFLIDGIPISEGKDYIVKDRELLANDGVIIISCNISLRLRKVLGNIEIISRGFLDKGKISSIVDELKSFFYKIIEDFLINDKQTKWIDFKNYLREKLSHFIFKVTKKKPIIIPALITID